MIPVHHPGIHIEARRMQSDDYLERRIDWSEHPGKAKWDLKLQVTRLHSATRIEWALSWQRVGWNRNLSSSHISCQWQKEVMLLDWGLEDIWWLGFNNSSASKLKISSRVELDLGGMQFDVATSEKVSSGVGGGDGWGPGASRLSFYQKSPNVEVSLEEFEQFALDRLHGMHLSHFRSAGGS